MASRRSTGTPKSRRGSVTKKSVTKETVISEEVVQTWYTTTIGQVLIALAVIAAVSAVSYYMMIGSSSNSLSNITPKEVDPFNTPIESGRVVEDGEADAEDTLAEDNVVVDAEEDKENEQDDDEDEQTEGEDEKPSVFANLMDKLVDFMNADEPVEDLVDTESQEELGEIMRKVAKVAGGRAKITKNDMVSFVKFFGNSATAEIFEELENGEIENALIEKGTQVAARMANQYIQKHLADTIRRTFTPFLKPKIAPKDVETQITRIVSGIMNNNEDSESFETAVPTVLNMLDTRKMAQAFVKTIAKKNANVDLITNTFDSMRQQLISVYSNDLMIQRTLQIVKDNVDVVKAYSVIGKWIHTELLKVASMDEILFVRTAYIELASVQLENANWEEDAEDYLTLKVSERRMKEVVRDLKALIDAGNKIELVMMFNGNVTEEQWKNAVLKFSKMYSEFETKVDIDASLTKSEEKLSSLTALFLEGHPKITARLDHLIRLSKWANFVISQ